MLYTYIYLHSASQQVPLLHSRQEEEENYFRIPRQERAFRYGFLYTFCAIRVLCFDFFESDSLRCVAKLRGNVHHVNHTKTRSLCLFFFIYNTSVYLFYYEEIL